MRGELDGTIFREQEEEEREEKSERERGEERERERETKWEFQGPNGSQSLRGKIPEDIDVITAADAAGFLVNISLWKKCAASRSV